jgi:serine/threonine protein kinase
MSKVFTITSGLENLGAFRTGGQGSVYKGRRTGEIITAVKLLPTPILNEKDDDKNFRDFKNEVEKLKKVNENPNPNVVKIISSGLTDSGSFPFIEMEYIDGYDLEELIKPPHEPVFRIKEVIKLTEHLSNAIAHCHSLNVKHGDIKSNNVKFNGHTGNYVLLDFGLAVMSDEDRRTSLRQAGAIEFMAPEQYDGKMLLQSDIYSFGIVIYEMLAGQVPFPLSDNSETARNNVRISHMENKIPDVLELRRNRLPTTWTAEEKEREMQVPQWILALLTKCLEKKFELRFRSGMELKSFINTNSVSQSRITGIGTKNQEREYLQIIAEKDLEIAGLTEMLHASTRKQHTGVRIPAPFFFLSLSLLCGLILFAGYTVLNKGSKSSDGEGTSHKTSAKISHPSLTGMIPEPIVINIDSIKSAEIEQRKNPPRAIASQPDVEKSRKKKKKFLNFLFKKN